MQLNSPKLIMNGHTSPSNNDNEPVKKKVRLEDSSSSLVPSFTQSNSIDEQSVPSSSLINNLKKKKKKKSHHLSSLITNGQHRKTMNHQLGSICDKISMQ